MLWYQDDLVDVANGKKACQSSIHPRWSFKDDAGRALKNISFESNAFHTCKENNPWWMVDLESEYYIEYINIYNIKQTQFRVRSTKLFIQLSLDGSHWTKIPQELTVWDKNLECCKVYIFKKCKARFLKIELDDCNFLHLCGVNVFVHQKNGYIVSAKPDGFAMRMCSILNGIYLANKLNFVFKFKWSDVLDIEDLNNYLCEQKEDGSHWTGMAMESADKIFSSNFLDKYYSDNSLLYFNYGFEISQKKRTFSELLNIENNKTPWGWYSNQAHVYDYIEDCDKNEYREEISNIYKDIVFSESLMSVCADVDIVCELNKLSPFVAIHIRSGDTIYSKVRTYPTIFTYRRSFPYEVAIEIIEKLICDNKIIVFGEDIDANIKLVEYFRKLNKNSLIYYADELIKDKNYTNIQRVFFDVNLMSRSSVIYSSGISTFSRLAMMISGKNEVISFWSMYKEDKLLEIIMNNFDRIKIHDFQKAMSYFRMFLLSKKINKDIEILIDFLQKALENDNENDAYRIFLIDCYFDQRCYKKIDIYLKSIFADRLDSFLSVLFCRQGRVYDAIIKKIITLENVENYIFIQFLIIRIFYFYNEKEKALNKLKSIINEQSNPFLHLLGADFNNYISSIGAIDRVKQHVAYRLGCFLKSYKGVKKYYYLCVFYLKEKKRKREKEKKRKMRLEDCFDYEQALNIINSKEYQNGLRFVNFYKKITKILLIIKGRC
ncbi:discoidin domain-containing protein [Campylobacter lari]|nr:discoidin domain-containing protein [Campylobacter lari]